MTEVNIERARFNMIEQQIRPWEVLDQRVLDVLAKVPREMFVPEPYKSLAFADTEIPLAHDQAMMAPRVEARMLQALNVGRNDRILEVGTGSGYVTACLATLGGQVTSLDIYAEFTENAGSVLQSLGMDNVKLITADALSGHLPDGPFDVIAVTGSLPADADEFESHLAPDGRMFLICGSGPVMQANLITRVGDTSWRREALFETRVPALVNAPEPEQFVF